MAFQPRKCTSKPTAAMRTAPIATAKDTLNGETGDFPVIFPLLPFI